MPIRPENRDRYPPDWPEVSRRIRGARRARERFRIAYRLVRILASDVDQADGVWSHELCSVLYSDLPRLCPELDAAAVAFAQRRATDPRCPSPRIEQHWMPF